MTLLRSYGIRIDLHVHTRRYSACAESLNPEQLPERMARSGLDGVVIAEHDHLWPAEEIDRLNQRLEKGRIYRGVEVSSCNGHFVVIGLQTMDGISPGIGISALVQRVRRQEAAIIWAHPQLCYSNTPAPCSLAELPQDIDAVEVFSGVTEGLHASQARAMARRNGWSQVAGSDAHILEHVGSVVTLFEYLPKNEMQLARAIREGCCATLQASGTGDSGRWP